MQAQAAIAPGPTDDQLNLVVQFGKHRGARVAAVPRDYMRWCLANMQWIEPNVKAAFEAVVNAPGAIPWPPSMPTPGRPPQEMVTIPREQFDDMVAADKRSARTIAELYRRVNAAEATVKAQAQAIAKAAAAVHVQVDDPGGRRALARRWYGRISRKYHPDLGGSADAQAVVNACYRELLNTLEESPK